MASEKNYGKFNAGLSTKIVQGYKNAINGVGSKSLVRYRAPSNSPSKQTFAELYNAGADYTYCIGLPCIIAVQFKEVYEINTVTLRLY